MANGTILQKNIDKIIPQQAYEKAMAMNPAVGSYVIVSVDENGMKELLIQSAEPMNTETFMDFQKEFQDRLLLVYLGDSKDQPFVLVDDGEEENPEPEVVVLYEGDFSINRPPKAAAPAYTFMVDKVLKPLPQAYFESLSEDAEPSVDGFMGYLDNTEVATALHAVSGNSRHALKVLANTGEIKDFSNNQLGGKFDWGELSQLNGYSEGSFPAKEEAAATPAQSKFQKWFANKGKPKSEQQPEAPSKDKPAATPAAPPDKEVPATKTDTAIPSGKVMARPRSGMSHSDTKTWYQKAVGYTPSKQNSQQSWKDRPWVAVDSGKLPKNSELQSGQPIAEAVVKASEKKLENKHIPSLMEQEQAKKAADIPVIPPAQLADFKAKFLEDPEIKKLMQGVQGLPTIEMLKSIEDKHPSFTQKTQQALVNVLQWPHHKRVDLCVNYAHLAALLIMSLSVEWGKGLLQRAQQKQTEEVEETPPAEAAPAKGTTISNKFAKWRKAG